MCHSSNGIGAQCLREGEIMGCLMDRRQVLLGGAAMASLAPWLSSCASKTQTQSPAAPSALKARVTKRTFNAHAHILPSNWWAPPGASKEAFQSTLEAAARTNQLVAARQLEGVPESVKSRYLDLAADRGKLWTFDDALAFYFERMDEAGIDAVFNLTMDNLPIGGRGDTSYTRDFMRILEDDYRARQAHPERLISFAGVDPRRGAEAVDLFEQAVLDFGFAGYGEMIGTLWDVSPADRTLMYPIMEKAAELKVPVFIDATQNKGRSQPADFEKLARDFPGVKICIAGAGAGVGPIETPTGTVLARDAFLALAERHEKLYLDLGDWQGVAAGEPPFRRGDGSAEITLRYLRRALDGPAGSRIMFGTDYPIFAGLYAESDWISTLFDAASELEIEFSDDDWGRFFADNAAEFIATGA
jgi:predicted TIM-barrel fold metal-dependent hydrolase